MQERDFKGVWIPKEIWLDERLNALDKVILAEINSLDGEKGCYASNDYIAEFCQCSASKVSKSIKKLTEFGYVYAESFDGRKRVLRSCLVKNARQNDKICEADEENLPDINIDNNKESNNTPYSPPREKKQKKELLTPSQEETGFSNEMQEAFTDWIKYKSERKFTYTETGLLCLVKKIQSSVKKYGSGAVIDIMQEAMASGYQGPVWDKLDKVVERKEKEKEKKKNDFPDWDDDSQFL